MTRCDICKRDIVDYHGGSIKTSLKASGHEVTLKCFPVACTSYPTEENDLFACTLCLRDLLRSALEAIEK